ncbi:flagellar type III secretion system pore protein FliP [Prosthecomicrobium hirschii]|uniref:flagellar type III secretion system pore protein FliP n=1 Tax=Prosthecodimorpha hirschii TaxID=665126 RepID=UPI0022205FE0|nr:flagellar type III secretion system pore protein FliP [Prosthecomicrobium hirschii]MCW1843986.1 flagellar type III secretion system pore protein FliP [Prosthecomicrobium hirschii]
MDRYPNEARRAGAIGRAAFSALAALVLLVAVASGAAAQDISINFGQGGTVTERAVQLVAVITVLSLAPSIVVMVTSFTRIVVVLSVLRSAIGLQTAPPNSVMISLALFLSAFVMGPVFNQAYDEGIKPLTEQTIELDQAIERAAQPFHVFMREHVREKDLELFVELAREPRPASAEAIPYRVLIPAFMISELRRAFEIGFLLYLPFLIIDLVVASVLMSMGMMMLPPVTISLPFKLIFFVLVDGWNLIAGSLVKSFG